MPAITFNLPCSGRHETTTRHVHRDVIVPQTWAQKCRYVRLIRGQSRQTDEAGRPYCGRALAYVCHSWDSSWTELVDAVCAHSDRWMHDYPTEEPPYYWIDIFAINQHDDSSERKEDMPDLGSMSPERGFQRVILRVGLVLALQDWWYQPRIVHSVWCLYEMSVALSFAAFGFGFHRVEGLLSSEVLRDMRASIVSGFSISAIEAHIGRIDVRTASALVASDRDTIFALIERDGGLEQFNERVRAMQRRMIVKHAWRMLDQRWIDEELQAEPWLTRVLARHRRLLSWAWYYAIPALVIAALASATSLIYTVAARVAAIANTNQLDGQLDGHDDYVMTTLRIIPYTYGFLGQASVSAIIGLIIWRLTKEAKTRLGPRKVVSCATVNKLTLKVWEGIVLNFLISLLCFGPWLVLLVYHFTGRNTHWALSAGVSLGERFNGIVSALYGFAIITSILVFYLLLGFMKRLFFDEMTEQASFMLTVARLAQRSEMLDVAERCLRDCLELCGRYGDVDIALEAHVRLVALLVHSDRMAEAKTSESAVHDLCAAQFTGWRGFLRLYVATGAPWSFSGLFSDAGMADNGVAYTFARLYAGLRDTNRAVAELARACDMGLTVKAIRDDELFQWVFLERPDELAGLYARTVINGRKLDRILVWRHILVLLTCLAFVSYIGGTVLLFLETKAFVCKDAYPTNCSRWASAGECTKTPDYMTANCPKSCNVCSGASSYLRGVDQASWLVRLRGYVLCTHTCLALLLFLPPTDSRSTLQ